MLSRDCNKPATKPGRGRAVTTARDLSGRLGRLERLATLRRLRSLGSVATLVVVALGPVLALLTLAVLGPLDRGTESTALRLVLLMDFVYLLILSGLVAIRLGRMITARRQSQAGSHLGWGPSGVCIYHCFGD